MADKRFFKNAGPFALSDIVSLTGAVATLRSGALPDGKRVFSNIAVLDQAGPDDISFLDNIKYLDMFSASKAGACFVRSKFTERAPEHMVMLVADDPYFAYAQTAGKYFPDIAMTPGVSPQAHIAATANIGQGVRIDAGAAIGEGAIIGDHCWIGANTVIHENVEIGVHSRIGACCTISHTIIGARAIFHRGVHVGQDGFGFTANRAGMIKVPQLGRVMIGNDVEIGSGTCVDRGAGPDTVIGDGCKIDNLVQIGHNVQLGKNVIIAGQSGIAGSTQIGDGTMLGAQSGLAGHLKIGAGAKLAAKSGAMSDVPAGATYGGMPAVPIKEWHRNTITVKKLSKKHDSSDTNE